MAGWGGGGGREVGVGLWVMGVVERRGKEGGGGEMGEVGWVCRLRRLVLGLGRRVGAEDSRGRVIDELGRIIWGSVQP